MASITFTPVVFAQYRKANGTYIPRIQVTYKRKSKYIPTNEVVTDKQLTKDLRIKDRAVNARLDTLICELRERAAKISLFTLQSMEVGDLVKAILTPTAEEFRLDFPTYATKVIGTLGEGARNYRAALHALEDFMGSDAFDIAELKSAKLRQFQAYLEERYGKTARAVSLYTRSIAYIHSRAREEFNSEEVDERVIANPYEYYKCPNNPKPKHRNASPDLIEKMLSERKGLEGVERVGVDVFLISFALMGMNSPDLYECKAAKDGIITYNRRKTRSRRADNAEQRVRIEPEVAALLDEYKGSDGMQFDFSKRWTTFYILSDMVNKGLKRFAKRIAWEEPLTLYTARHTWASIAGSRLCCIDKGTINDCLCHTDPDYSVTDIYRAKDWEVLWDANRKVLNLFTWN